jgi:hypothetical protein
MTLGKVGSGEGPDTDRIAALARARPDASVLRGRRSSLRRRSCRRKAGRRKRRADRNRVSIGAR